MSAMWEQVGGDVNPKTYGCILASQNGDRVDVVRIDPSEDDDKQWHVTSGSFYESDLTWNGQAEGSALASGLGISKQEYEELPLKLKASAALEHHGSGWSGETDTVSKWSAALPVDSRKIKWFRK